MSNDIIAQGIELMLYGMGMVLSFLTLLVLCTMAMSRLIERYATESTISIESVDHGAVDSKRVAAITAAVQRYRAQAAHRSDRRG